MDLNASRIPIPPARIDASWCIRAPVRLKPVGRASRTTGSPVGLETSFVTGLAGPTLDPHRHRPPTGCRVAGRHLQSPGGDSKMKAGLCIPFDRPRAGAEPGPADRLGHG